MNPPHPLGVLTFHRCINYGSYWQARCLLEGLKARGREAVLLDPVSSRVGRAEWACALRPVLPTPVPRADRLRYGVKMLRFRRALSGLPRSRRFPLDRPAAMPEFERVVVGSDEVWNLRHPWYGGCPLFFGEGVRARRLIAYAASFGHYPAAWGLEPAWAERLRHFDCISVRDGNSRDLIATALGFEPERVLDPCLQFLPRPEGPWRGPRGGFVAVYGHNFSARFGRAVRHWAEARRLPLVSLGYRNDWADRQWLAAGPDDFAHAMARAQAVATNFFHGCVFALRHAQPFVCEDSPYRAGKIRDLLALAGAENRGVTEDAPAARYEAALGEPPDPAVLRRIEDGRRRSAAWLDRALA
jgi:hypothetical protein